MVAVYKAQFTEEPKKDAIENSDEILIEKRIAEINNRLEAIRAEKEQIKTASQPKRNYFKEDLKSVGNTVGEVARQVGRTGRLIGTGLSYIGDIGNLPAIGLHAAGLKETPEFYPSPSQNIKKGIDYLTNDKLKPRNKTEEYVDSIGESIAPFLINPATGGASITSFLAKTYGKNAPKVTKKVVDKIAHSRFKPYEITPSKLGATVGGAVGAKAYSDNVENPGVLGTVASGLGGALVGGAGGRAAAIARNYGPNSLKYNELAKIGVPMSVADVSNNRASNYLEQFLGKDITSSHIIKKHEKKRSAAYARALGKTNLDPLENSQIPKDLAKEGAEEYQENINRNFNLLKEPVVAKELAALNNHHMVDVSELFNALDSQKKHLKSQAAINTFYTKTPAGIFAKKLEEHAASHRPKELSRIDDIRKYAKQNNLSEETVYKLLAEENLLDHVNTSRYLMPYGELEQLRKLALAEKDKAWSTAADAHVYGNFAESRKNFIKKIGTPEEIKAFENANALFAEYKKDGHKKQSNYNYAQKVIDSPDDVQAFEKLTSTNPKYAQIVMAGLPKEKKRVLSEAVISSKGNDNGKFNIFRAYSKLTNLDPKVLASNLQGYSPQERSTFRLALKNIGELKDRVGEVANTSGTAHMQSFISATRSGGMAAASAITGNPLPIGLEAGWFLAKNGTAKLWTNQSFVKSFDKLMNAKSQTKKMTYLERILQNPVVKQVLENNT